MDKFLYFQLYNLGHTSIGDAEPLVTKSILFHKMFWLFDVQIGKNTHVFNVEVFCLIPYV